MPDAMCFGGNPPRSRTWLWSFVPFLSEARCIAALCDKSPLPVNILRSPDGPGHAELAHMGVARISHGHQPWAAAMKWLEGQAAKIFAGAEPDY